jgi:hypothetical protein
MGGNMLGKLFDLFFGCWHKRLSFRMTLRAGVHRSMAGSPTGTYVVCLNCGKELPYDWVEMKLAEPPSEPGVVRALAAKQAS